jgi:hypothetical protein
MLVSLCRICFKSPVASVFAQVKTLNKLVRRFSFELLDFKK